MDTDGGLIGRLTLLNGGVAILNSDIALVMGIKDFCVTSRSKAYNKCIYIYSVPPSKHRHELKICALLVGGVLISFLHHVGFFLATAVKKAGDSPNAGDPSDIDVFMGKSHFVTRVKCGNRNIITQLYLRITPFSLTSL